MPETPSQNHNRLAPELLTRLVKECNGDEAQSMIVLESVILGVMKVFRPDPREAAEFLDHMTAQVIERMGDG